MSTMRGKADANITRRSEIRQALINKIDELMPEAHSPDATVDVKIEYAVAKRGTRNPHHTASR